ncbi:protein angel [Haematobia irritans]|uniref:protein angel n=1 Tax=Haematobia irritans TaxID=7368 RepID=UPI003F4F7BA5
MFRWNSTGATKYLANILRFECDSIKQQKCQFKKASNKKAQQLKMERNWQPPLLRDNTNTSYRLLSYNILAQQLLTDNIFLYYDIDPRYLHWKYRVAQLQQEIRKIQPDILCLQEVQHANLKELVQLFGSRYNGSVKLEYVFKKRTGDRCDGCAIIYDRSKFRLVEDRCIEYHDENNPTSNRENVALMAKFALRSAPETMFVAVTTHLLYNPKRHDVRISQIGKLIKGILKFSIDPTKENGRYPVILTGDFNCTADSTPFHVLTAERKPGAQEGNEKPNQRFQMEPISFGSDCASTFQNQWIIVDYILKSYANSGEKSIKIHNTYNLPNIRSCLAHGKIPNRYYGSDHFSLAIQFSII